ncbi:MAG: DUF1559 domain-containing protein [Gimesia maris]
MKISTVWAGSNDLINNGSGLNTEYWMPENDGLFWWGLSSQLGDITDGTTNTIFMAEPLFGNRGPDTATLLAPDRQMNRVSGRSRCSATADDLVSRDATGYEGGCAGMWIYRRSFSTI